MRFEEVGMKRLNYWNYVSLVTIIMLNAGCATNSSAPTISKDQPLRSQAARPKSDTLEADGPLRILMRRHLRECLA
jgi:hypothetical protein